MATPNTKKNSLTLPIGALAVPALVAGPGRVTSVYSFKLDTLLARNVRDLQKERRERPSVVNQSSLFGHPDSGSNALEVFDDYRPGAGLQAFINDPGIDANARITLRVWNILCNNQMRIPDSTFARDCGRWLDFPRPVEILPVID